MLKNLTLILLCQLIGEIIVRVAKIPIPGPVIGMVILFCGLSFRRGIPPELEKVGGVLHRYLPLLFVPAGAGIVTNLDLLMKFWAPFAGSIIVGTIITIAVTGVVMQLLNRRHKSYQDEQQP